MKPTVRLTETGLRGLKPGELAILASSALPLIVLEKANGLTSLAMLEANGPRLVFTKGSEDVVFCLGSDWFLEPIFTDGPTSPNPGAPGLYTSQGSYFLRLLNDGGALTTYDLSDPTNDRNDLPGRGMFVQRWRIWQPQAAGFDPLLVYECGARTPQTGSAPHR